MWEERKKVWISAQSLGRTYPWTRPKSPVSVHFVFRIQKHQEIAVVSNVNVECKRRFPHALVYYKSKHVYWRKLKGKKEKLKIEPTVPLHSKIHCLYIVNHTPAGQKEHLQENYNQMMGSLLGIRREGGRKGEATVKVSTNKMNPVSAAV